MFNIFYISNSKWKIIKKYKKKIKKFIEPQIEKILEEANYLHNELLNDPDIKEIQEEEQKPLAPIQWLYNQNIMRKMFENFMKIQKKMNYYLYFIMRYKYNI